MKSREANWECCVHRGQWLPYNSVPFTFVQEVKRKRASTRPLNCILFRRCIFDRRRCMKINKHERENSIRRHTHSNNLPTRPQKKADNNTANTNKDCAMKYYDKIKKKKKITYEKRNAMLDGQTMKRSERRSDTYCNLILYSGIHIRIYWYILFLFSIPYQATGYATGESERAMQNCLWSCVVHAVRGPKMKWNEEKGKKKKEYIN